MLSVFDCRRVDVRMFHLYVTSVCYICMLHLYVTSVCYICMLHLYVPSVCSICMLHLYVTSVCSICMFHLYVTSVCYICMLHLYVTSVWISTCPPNFRFITSLPLLVEIDLCVMALRDKKIHFFNILQSAAAVRRTRELMRWELH